MHERCAPACYSLARPLARARNVTPLEVCDRCSPPTLAAVSHRSAAPRLGPSRAGRDEVAASSSRASPTDDYRFVYAGYAGSRTCLHADVARSHSWSVNVAGVKRCDIGETSKRSACYDGGHWDPRVWLRTPRRTTPRDGTSTRGFLSRPQVVAAAAEPHTPRHGPERARAVRESGA